MPRIISAAIKFKPKDSDYFQIMCGHRHCDVLEMMYKLRIDYERTSMVQGFLTNEDQFLDRYDAAIAAFQAGQILPESDLYEKMHNNPDLFYAYQLYSEDMW